MKMSNGYPNLQIGKEKEKKLKIRVGKGNVKEDRVGGSD